MGKGKVLGGGLKSLWTGIKASFSTGGAARGVLSAAATKFTFKNIGKISIAGFSGAVIWDTFSGGNIVTDTIHDALAAVGVEASNSTINLGLIGIVAVIIVGVIFIVKRKVS